MKTRWYLTTLSLLAMSATPPQASLPPVGAYAGSEACRACHSQKYQDWKQTFHSTVVQDARRRPEAVLGDFAQGVDGIDLEVIDYTIGGHWTQRYVRRVEGELYVLPQTWSVASHRWETQDRWSWQRKPYSEYCVGCHTTRYDPEDRSFVEHTVGCEACHGPGRAHVQGEGRGAILNPAKISQDERDLLCASCHVRGTDPSGRYQFAVGYVPGRPLEEHYVPIRAADGEGRRDALLRLFREWRGRVERGEPPTCDLCGISRPTDDGPLKAADTDCRACHEFAERYAAHTRHPSGVTLQCLDCHRRTATEETATQDVHSREYFLVHRGAGFASTPVGACLACHPDHPPSELAARLLRWEDSHAGVRD